MKKILLVAVAVLMTAPLFAEKMSLIQGTYLSTQRIIQAPSGEKLTETIGQFGINTTNFSGDGFGFYSTATLLYPTNYKISFNGESATATFSELGYSGLRLGMDMLMGVGIHAPLSSSFSILAGAGLHFNGLIFFSDNSNYLSYCLGPGASLNALLHLTPTMNFNIGALAAWDVWEFIHLPTSGYDVTYKGGITWAISVGIGIKY